MEGLAFILMVLGEGLQRLAFEIVSHVSSKKSRETVEDRRLSEARGGDEVRLWHVKWAKASN